MTYFNMTSCEAIIIWRSPHACPLLVPMTPVSDSVCSITDPSDGTVLNLQPLTDGGQVTSADGNYIIGLCGPIDKVLYMYVMCYCIILVVTCTCLEKYIICTCTCYTV